MDSFECAVCLQQLDDPRVISCGHTFCKGCLQKLRQLLCPLCRRTFESVDLLPSNFVVLKWMDESKNQNILKKEIKCDNCEDKLAVVWCEKCEINYCNDCDSTAHFIKVLRSHLRIGIKEKSKKVSFIKCNCHLEENKFYCLDCKSLICSVCVVDDHPLHKTMSIFKYGEILKNDLRNLLSTFNETIKYFNDKEIKIKEDLLGIERNKVELIKKLNEIDENFKNKKIEEEIIIHQKRKAETSLIVLTTSIEEIGTMELMNKNNFELMKDRIKKVDEELCPSEVKQRLEKERLEKERLEKERLEKERLEKKRLVKWDASKKGSKLTITGNIVTYSGSGGHNVVLAENPLVEDMKWNINVDFNGGPHYVNLGILKNDGNWNVTLPQNGQIEERGLGWPSQFPQLSGISQNSIVQYTSGDKIGFHYLHNQLQLSKNGQHIISLKISNPQQYYPAVSLYYQGDKVTLI